MKKIFTALLICSAVTSAFAVPTTRASAYLVKDIATGNVLASKNINEQKPIASLTKLMTAMVVLDAKLPANEILTISEDDVDNYKHSKSRLSVGTVMSRDLMLHLALMSSENRAAHALARTYPGGLNTFIKDMNLKAKSLGLKSTVFVDPTGLSEQNVSNVSDLSVIVEAASKYPKIKQFSTDKEEEVQHKKYTNTNPLARGENSWPLLVSKTGFTQEAGRCLVMNTIIKNRQTALIILDSPSKDGRVRDAMQLKSWLNNSKLAEDTHSKKRIKHA